MIFEVCYASINPNKTAVLYFLKRNAHAEGEYHLFSALCNAGGNYG